jgi:hypothetical protein
MHWLAAGAVELARAFMSTIVSALGRSVTHSTLGCVTNRLATAHHVEIVMRNGRNGSLGSAAPRKAGLIATVDVAAPCRAIRAEVLTVSYR